jgi:hypothetical protein
MEDKNKFRIDDFTDESKPSIKEYICKICNYIGDDLYSDPCGHSFCYKCILPYINTFGVCPIENNTLSVQDLIKAPFIDNIINKHHIYCPNKNAGCEWIDTIIKRNLHIDNCSYELVDCKYLGCSLKIMRKDELNHLIKCDYSLSCCDLCRSPILKKDIQQHLDDECLYTEITCPQSCGLNIIRSQIENHIKHYCDLSIVPCDFKEYNCDELIFKKDKKTHFISYGYIHELSIINSLTKIGENLTKNLNDISESFKMYDLEISKLEGKNIDKKKKQKKKRAYKMD